MYASTSTIASRSRELLQGLEQRSHERVNLALECRVTAGGKRSGGTMKLVENISRTGILIRWLPSDGPQDVPRPGDTLNIEMALPANHNFDRKCWFCGGTVVRVSKAEDHYGDEPPPIVCKSQGNPDFPRLDGVFVGI